MNITVCLEYGDNYPGIYSKEKLYIDDIIPELSSGTPNDFIMLKIEYNEYLAKTNKSGFAVFQIPTNKLNPGNHKFILLHNSTKIATSINESSTLKIIKNKLKSKKNKKGKSKTKKSIKKTRKIANKKVLIKKSKKQNKKKSAHSKHKTRNKKNKITLAKTSRKQKYETKKVKVVSSLEKPYKCSKEKSNILDSLNKIRNSKNWKYLENGYNSIVNFLNITVLSIPNYKETLDSWGLAGDIIKFSADFLLGIDENGNLSIGNLALNILSLFSGVGIFSRLGVKFTTKFPRLIKILQHNNNIKLIYKFLPKLDSILTKLSEGLSFLTNPFKKIFSKIFDLEIIKRFKYSKKVLFKLFKHEISIGKIASSLGIF